MIAKYTTHTPIITKESAFIGNAKLAVHGSYGNQLLDYNKVSKTITSQGININNNNGVFTTQGKGDTGAEVTLQPVGSMWLDAGSYVLSGGLSNFYAILNNITTNTYILGYMTQRFTLNKKCEFRVFVRVVGGFDELTEIKPMLCKGTSPLPFEPYTGGTPYTDKYKPSITGQTANSVTLSIENVSATEGETTELDIELTDKNGVTKRSEVGKPFIGGAES